MHRMGHVVTRLGPAHPHRRSRLIHGAATLARQALPRLDERAQHQIVRAALYADCEIVINVDRTSSPARWPDSGAAALG